MSDDAAEELAGWIAFLDFLRIHEAKRMDHSSETMKQSAYWKAREAARVFAIDAVGARIAAMEEDDE